LTKFSFTYTGIRIKNIEDSVKFYTEVLGMKETGRGVTVNGRTTVGLQSSDSQQVLELNYYPENSEFATPYKNGDEIDHLGFAVDDLAKACDELITKGVEFALEPSRTSKGLAFFKDPNGIWIELFAG
jgi:lactoylglutathione lyase